MLPGFVLRRPGTDVKRAHGFFFGLKYFTTDDPTDLSPATIFGGNLLVVPGSYIIHSLSIA
jgi:hypothetical protein